MADIAGVPVAIDAGTPWLEGPLGARYRPFAPALSPAPLAEPALSVELLDHPATGPCPAEHPGCAGEVARARARGEAPDYPLAIDLSGDRLEVGGAWMTGAVDLARGHGRAIACARDPIGAVENFFRVGVAHLLPARGGFLLHATAVITARGAVVAFGESGAGKSTLASYAGPRAVVSDDLVALTRDPLGRLVVVPAPFRPGGAAARPEGHVVRLLARLRKTPHGAFAAQARALPAAMGAAALVGSMPFVLDHPETASRALALAAAAAAEPGVHELSFAPREGVWDAIEEALA